MKVFKKLAGLILAVCLAVPVFGTVAFAADGVLMYSDPSTKVGENVSIDLVVQSNSGETVGNVQVNMNYDPTALEFVSGEGFTADGSGALTYSGTGSGAELRVPMTFRALKAGEAKINVDSTSATLADGETLELRQGSSTVTIEAADDGTTQVEPTAAAAGATTDIVVNVNGTDYNFSEAFTGTDIPDGFAETTLTFNGADRKFVANEAGVALGYLVDASGAGSFFLFNQEDATFSPYIQLFISDTTSIVPLASADSVSLPDTYQQVELTVQEQQYPAWSDPMAPRYYVLNALNTRTGETHLYQYDTDDGTYQYFIAPDQAEDESGGALPIPGKIGDFINGHLLLFFVAMVIVGLILFIMMIVFAVKLVHRNQELDDLYDEYDIPFDDEDDDNDKKSKKKSSGKSSVKKDRYDDYDDDAYEDDEDDYDDEYDDDYDDEDDYDDDDYDDEGNTTEITGKKSRKSRKSDDDYDIDFVGI